MLTPYPHDFRFKPGDLIVRKTSGHLRIVISYNIEKMPVYFLYRVGNLGKEKDVIQNRFFYHSKEYIEDQYELF